MRIGNVNSSIKRRGSCGLALVCFLLISRISASGQVTSATRSLISDAALTAYEALTAVGTQPRAANRSKPWAEHALKNLADYLRPSPHLPAGQPPELVFSAPGPFYHLTAQTALLTIGDLRRTLRLPLDKNPPGPPPGVPLPQEVLNALSKIWRTPSVQTRVKQQDGVRRAAWSKFLSSSPTPPPFDPNMLMGPLPLKDVPERLTAASLSSSPPNPSDKYVTPFVYTIYFENLASSSTGPASEVKIVYTPSPLQNGLGAQSTNLSFHHPGPTDTISLILNLPPTRLMPGLPYRLGSTPVNLTFLNLPPSLSWKFSGAPNTLPQGGTGSISFQIMPVVPQRDVSVVRNPGATIQFDMLLPVITTNRWPP